MYLLLSCVSFAFLPLSDSVGMPPTFTEPQGNRWSVPTQYVRVRRYESDIKIIKCHADATPTARYYWTINGVNITRDESIISFSETSGTLETGPGFKEKHSGEIQCIAYNQLGTLMTPGLSLIGAVHGSFSGNVQIVTVEVFESKYIKLDCEGVPKTVPPPRFSWYRGTSDDPADFEVFGQEDRMIIDHEGSLHFLWTELDDSYSYTCATFNIVFLSTFRNPKVIKLNVKKGGKDDRGPELKYERDLVVHVGEKAVLMCIFSYFSTAGNKLVINWLHAGEKMHTGQTYTLNSVQFPTVAVDQEGEYLCEATLGSTKRFGRVNLKIVGPPTFVPGQAPETRFIPVEKTAVIECKTNSHNTYSYPPAWFQNGRPLVGCPKFYFECNDRQSDGYSNCLHEDSVCNHYPDCANEDDEKNCQGSCVESQKRCGDVCIPENAYCKEQTCNYPEYQCRRGIGCISGNKTCNGRPDCNDGSDETACPGGSATRVGRFQISSDRTQLRFPHVGPQDTMCFQCMVGNEYGSVLGDACLTVIDKILLLKWPNSTYYVEPGSQLDIIVDARTDVMMQNQMEFIWQWYVEVTDKKTGTTSLVRVRLPPGGSTAKSFRVQNNGKKLTIVFPEVTQDDDSSYKVYDKLINRQYTLVIRHMYDTVELNFTINGKQIINPEPAIGTASTNLWFIAIILGVLLLFVIVALIICYMYRNRGGTYLVDEKEKKAGNDPEQELKDSGFHDVGRVDDEPDHDTPKADKASLSESVNPYESDDDPTMEYGDDFESSKFNEDGSFIGVYIDKKDTMKEVTV